MDCVKLAEEDGHKVLFTPAYHSWAGLGSCTSDKDEDAVEVEENELEELEEALQVDEDGQTAAIWMENRPRMQQNPG